MFYSTLQLGDFIVWSVIFLVQSFNSLSYDSRTVTDDLRITAQTTPMRVFVQVTMNHHFLASRGVVQSIMILVARVYFFGVARVSQLSACVFLV
jgi:hypothetical protein